MPTRYEPELDHKPLGWGSRKRGPHLYKDPGTGAISRRVPDTDTEVIILLWRLRSKREDIFNSLKACKPDVESDDRLALMMELRTLLIKFLANCRAAPLRSPRKLLPTVELIKKDPGEFLARSEDYSPEAAGLVFAQYHRLFPDRRDLAEFEAGLVSETVSVPALDPWDIARAADAAIAVLEEQAETWPRGRPAMELVQDLSADLGKLFVGFGGHLRRTVHDGESGPFHAFLTLIAELVRDPLRDTGYTLTPETMVDFAREALLKPKP